jgi:antitoxin HigA-1
MSRSSITTEVREMSKQPSERLPNIHPGEILLEEFLRPLGLSQNRLAREIHVPPRRINEIVLAKRSLTPDTALRLARYFGTSERFWLGLQLDYDLEEAHRSRGERIEREIVPREKVLGSLSPEEADQLEESVRELRSTWR